MKWTFKSGFAKRAEMECKIEASVAGSRDIQQYFFANTSAASTREHSAGSINATPHVPPVPPPPPPEEEPTAVPSPPPEEKPTTPLAEEEPVPTPPPPLPEEEAAAPHPAPAADHTNTFLLERDYPTDRGHFLVQ